MTRIISGFETQGGDYDNMAVLRGYKEGAAARKAAADASRSEEFDQMRMMLAIKGAMLEQERFELSKEKEQRETEKLKRADAEVGKAGKLQQMAQRAQAGQVNPGQKFVERVIGARGRLQDPKALAMFDASVEDLLKSQKAAKSRKAAEDAIGMAEQDTQDFTPEEVQLLRQELDAGGEGDIIVRKIQEKRMKNAAESLAVEENDQLLAQAQQLVDAAREGFGKEQAKIALRVAMRSDSLKKRKGSGAMALKQVEEALLGPRSEYGQGQQDPFSDPDERGEAIKVLEIQNRDRMKRGEPEAPITEQAIRARIGRKYGQRPQPTPQEEQVGKTRREAADKPYFLERRGAGVGKVVTEAVRGGARGADIVKLIRDQGLDPGDPAVMAEIEAALGGGR